MPAGRPKKLRPLSGKTEELREAAEIARRNLPPCNLPEQTKEFVLELIAHFLELDRKTTKDIAELLEKIAADTTIADPTKVYLRLLLHRHDVADSQERMQIRTLVGSALVGKPPEAPRNHGRGLRTLPGGREVPSPDFGPGGLKTGS